MKCRRCFAKLTINDSEKHRKRYTRNNGGPHPILWWKALKLHCLQCQHTVVTSRDSTCAIFNCNHYPAFDKRERVYSKQIYALLLPKHTSLYGTRFWRFAEWISLPLSSAESKQVIVVSNDIHQIFCEKFRTTI